MIPENFIYFSFNLTDSSYKKLEDIIFSNKIIQEILSKKKIIKKYLHHCTLFYKNSCLYNQSILSAEDIYNCIEDKFENEIGKVYKIKIVGWGWSNKALALLVDEKSIEVPILENHKYHITVYTFDNAKPVESNNIKNWHLFEDSIEIDCILSKTILK